MTTTKRADYDEAMASLARLVPNGSTVYTILRGEPSRSGMTRTIGLVVFLDGQPYHPNWAAATVLGRRMGRHGDGVVCQGGGMDMGFELVYTLAQRLYGDGYALTQRWL